MADGIDPGAVKVLSVKERDLAQEKAKKEAKEK